MHLTPPASPSPYADHARHLVTSFARHGELTVALDRRRDVREFAGPGAYSVEIDGYPHAAPPLTRVEITGGIRTEPGQGLSMPGELRERAALFHTIDRGATADGVVTIEEAAAFLRNFDATPEDGVFEATQQARLAGAFPERFLARARFRVRW